VKDLNQTKIPFSLNASILQAPPMELLQKIEVLTHVGSQLKKPDAALQQKMEEAYQKNKWFTIENTLLALENIADRFLNTDNLNQWLSDYPVDHGKKKVGIIMAGNIPLVGFHDFLCLIVSGHSGKIKLSFRDDVLLPYIMTMINTIDGEVLKDITLEDQLKGMDAYVTTGSNNTSRYFLYYFGKYAHLIRSHRNGVAVLTGNETNEEIHQLGKDIFSFFGLGCRNVSKLYVPKGYDFSFFLENLSAYQSIIQHNKYKNNYDYHRAVLLLNKTPHLANDLLILVASEKIASPVASLYYEFYENAIELNQKLESRRSEIQCIVGWNGMPFGTTQSPELWDYADGVDTMKFLSELN
jgi:hypothetical protein